MPGVVIGVDLSGPANTADTAVVCFAMEADHLTLMQSMVGAGDGEIMALVAAYAGRGDVVVGLDAPLSYNPGGGDRPADRELRRRIIEAGLQPGSVMTPTLTRMAYLTLRGICVARLVSTIDPPPKIVEVHPGAAMALRGAPIAAVKSFKSDAAAQGALLSWLEQHGLSRASSLNGSGDHMVAACAGALAAWKWWLRESAWLAPAQPPFHPFDFAC